MNKLLLILSVFFTFIGNTTAAALYDKDANDLKDDISVVESKKGTYEVSIKVPDGFTEKSVYTGKTKVPFKMKDGVMKFTLEKTKIKTTSVQLTRQVAKVKSGEVGDVFEYYNIELKDFLPVKK